MPDTKPVRKGVFAAPAGREITTGQACVSNLLASPRAVALSSLPMGRLAILAWAFLGLLLLGADAEPQRRVALVIGNGTYAEAGTLANPVNDALDIADKLRSIGFEVI
ncbi:hypothetical protein LB577_10110 [Mesorhizobium sp. B283B1A]|uniref:caspase family protein n=1 Tax=Mesorhizobium TaxID=68287 RepID=UPI001CD055A8|nr:MULTISPECIES: caspase family protein [Mesorhizobium]MCA0047310.1 hypothetical protein [Mesorhizobium sp. B283B1A]UQS66270.1 hypothetical protein M5D98_07900 [Mesorhizobium opportunistum]